MGKYQPDKYWENRLAKDFSLGGVGFLGLGKEYNKWLYKARLRALSKFLQKHHINPYGARILDIGVGTGFYVDFWKKSGVKYVTGLDITQKSISELTIKYPQYTFIKEDISGEVSFKEQFDIITAFDILFHIVDEEKFERTIRNIRKMAHDNTLILISDNFLKEYNSAAFHENDRTLDKYKQVLHAYNLCVVDIEPIFYFSNSPVDVGAIRSRSLQLLLIASWGVFRRMLYYANHRKIRWLGGRIVGLVIGTLLYHFDGICLKFAKTGPSTKLLLAQPKKPHDQL